MSGGQFIKKTLIERFSEPKPGEAEQAAPEAGSAGARSPRRLNHFLNMAAQRKRQILEKMLMD